MRARDRDLPPGLGAEYGLRHGLVGIGPGAGPRRERLIHGFATAEEGGYVWTRDRAGAYHLGRIAGRFEEDTAAAAAAVGITHVRRAVWLTAPVAALDVPDAVRRTFARGGRNFQRTRDADAEARSDALWRAR